MGLLQIGYPLGWALASLWAAWLLSSHGWRMLFLVGLVSLPYVWVVRRFIHEPERFRHARHTGSDRPRISELLGPDIRRRALLLFGASFIGNVVGPSAVGFVTDLLTPRYGDMAIRHSMLIIAVTPVLTAACLMRAARLYGERAHG